MTHKFDSIKHLLKTDSKAVVKAAKYFATYYVASLLNKNDTRFRFGGGNVSQKRLIVSIVQHLLKYKQQPTFKQLNILKSFCLEFKPVHWLLSEVSNGILTRELPITDIELLAFDSSYFSDGHKTH